MLIISAYNKYFTNLIYFTSFRYYNLIALMSLLRVIILTSLFFILFLDLPFSLPVQTVDSLTPAFWKDTQTKPNPLF
jgi:hypothetical protein